MSEPARGPQVPASEALRRAITSLDWWVAAEDRVSSAAFAFPVFSVDVASLATPEQTLGRFKAGCGLVQFNSGAARQLGFDARQELDARFPENSAHANVYCDLPKNERKRRAQQLVSLATILRAPTLSAPP
ncbi:MAG TPA: hypothetical protein VFI31_27985 [Pirellulales bacterium]|nr:hypothetical protein [Pirellulales bacterium]